MKSQQSAEGRRIGWRVTLVAAFFFLDRFIKYSLWFSPRAGSGDDMIQSYLNTNAAFSLDLPSWLDPLLLPVMIGITLLLAAKVVLLIRERNSMVFWWGMLFVGALSNSMDRIQLGGVLDYIDLKWWPVFNMSDVYITISVAMIGLHELVNSRRRKA